MTLSRATFDPLIHQTFTVHLDEGMSLGLRLEDIRSRQRSPRYESFTLDLVPPEGAPLLPDGSYLMEAPGFGPEWLYISATHAGTPDPRDYYYESVFNVLH